jgi:hypothetical protein
MIKYEIKKNKFTMVSDRYACIYFHVNILIQEQVD